MKLCSSNLQDQEFIISIFMIHVPISLYTIDIIFGIVFCEIFMIDEDDIYDSYIHNFLLLKVFLFDNP